MRKTLILTAVSMATLAISALPSLAHPWREPIRQVVIQPLPGVTIVTGDRHDDVDAERIAYLRHERRHEWEREREMERLQEIERHREMERLRWARHHFRQDHDDDDRDDDDRDDDCRD